MSKMRATTKFNNHQKRTSQARAKRALAWSCLDNREIGALPHFFVILVVFWGFGFLRQKYFGQNYETSDSDSQQSRLACIGVSEFGSFWLS